ncbi:MAG: helicase HerA-like domain-containing protein [Bacteroidota bacterium]
MAGRETFEQEITAGYQFRGDSIILGGSVFDGSTLNNVLVRAPLRTFNRHGLIAGATGTGKTKTLQMIAESLSSKGVPVLLMDMKGDVSGISQAGESNPKIQERHQNIGVPWKAGQFPVEFLTISSEPGVRMRATVSEFGPVLFSKILELNDTQAGVVSLVFKYCDDHQLPLLDLKDFKKTLHFLTNEGKVDVEKDYGRLSTATTGTILRKVVEIEQEGSEMFFGEKSFAVEDLLRVNESGVGVINILRLTDIQSKPRMFSTFMLCLLAEIYATFPEEGDPDQPKLVVFIDEAHLVFREASRALLEQLETIIKLIRSKGVGIIFCTQTPTDIPAPILAQLGMKVQHALRAFTAQDRKAIKQAAENYPLTEYYKTDELLTALGIGEAFVSVLNEQGIPTPLVHTMMCAPASRMGTLTPAELQQMVTASSLARSYNEHIDRESAYEMLTAKIQNAVQAAPVSSQGKPEKSTIEKVIADPLTRQIGRTVAREVTRGLLGVLGLGGRSRRTSLF